MKNELESQRIIIAERDNIAAVIEKGKVAELFVHRGDILIGDVYLAQVENVLPSIDAAFVNVGSDKMGFLHAQDVLKNGALKDKLAPKQKLIVQVVKEPTGHKGPRVTTDISLPGRFLVLMPTEVGINVSKKIESVKEKARLKSIVNLLKPVGVGVIVRTEAEGQSEADIQEDLEILLEKWNNIITSADTLSEPTLIYRDQDLLYRVIREACTEQTEEIVVDTAFALNRVQNLLQNWHMNKNIKTTLYKGTEPILLATDVYKEIKAALNTKVSMQSGGYLFIQSTEALTVIDVNSGKFVSSATQDETILKTNIEAVHEIARQLKLRNIGGMIIIDFIDMTSRVDKLAVMEELEIALENDKAKPQVGQLSDLGLVELTRHRQGQSLAEIFSKRCPHCQGTGYVLEDIKFASPTAEGEYRSKQAKLKLPISGFKRPNKFNNNRPNNNNNNNPRQQEENRIEQPQLKEENYNPSEVATDDMNKINNEATKKNQKRGKFNKNKAKEIVSENADVKIAQTVIDSDSIIAPEITKEKVEQEVKVAEQATVEVQAETAEQPKTKGRRPNRNSKQKQKKGKATDEKNQ